MVLHNCEFLGDLAVDFIKDLEEGMFFWSRGRCIPQYVCNKAHESIIGMIFENKKCNFGQLQALADQ